MWSKKGPSGELQPGAGQNTRDDLLHSQQVHERFPSLSFSARAFYLIDQFHLGTLHVFHPEVQVVLQHEYCENTVVTIRSRRH